MKTLSATLERNNNNFDLIRLAAALAVMLGHSFGLRRGGNVELMLRFTHRESFGSLAVFGFFLISGLLVSASYEKQSSPLRFAGLRALRIWPGAMVCALFIALVVGPLFTSVRLSDYFLNSQTLHWLMHNMSLIGGVGGFLPGVFEKNHFPLLVNATMWTLPIELECYVIVLIAGLLGAIGSKRGTVLVLTVVGVIFTHFALHPPVHITLGHFFIIPMAYAFYPVPFFLLGMLLYPFREYVFLHWLPAVSLLMAYVVLRYTVIGEVLLYPAFAYGLLWVASVRRLRKFKPRHDYSYGIYLYGFVVQQSVTALYPALNNYLNVAIAIPITIVLASLSWHFVERPCLLALRERRSPVLEASPVTAGTAS